MPKYKVYLLANHKIVLTEGLRHNGAIFLNWENCLMKDKAMYQKWYNDNYRAGGLNQIRRLQ